MLKQNSVDSVKIFDDRKFLLPLSFTSHWVVYFSQIFSIKFINMHEMTSVTHCRCHQDNVVMAHLTV